MDQCVSGFENTWTLFKDLGPKDLGSGDIRIPNLFPFKSKIKRGFSHDDLILFFLEL